MKRTISILLVAMLLLVALPTFAEEASLQPGLYVSDDELETLYLDETGGGVLNYDANGQYLANGVRWTEGSLEIEWTAIPIAVRDNTVIFTYGGAVRMLHYVNAGEAYALGDREGMAFAGTYLAEDGRKMTLSADGRGVFADKEILWGSMMPYWANTEGITEGTCFALFGSYLSSMYFEGDTVVVSTENEGDITLQRQAAAVVQQPTGEGQLYYGYRMFTDGQTIEIVPFLTALGMDPTGIYLELRSDGTGTFQFMDEDEKAEFTWTEDAISYDGESVPYTREGDHIILTIEDESIEFAPAAEMEALLNGASTGTDNKTTTDVGPADSDGLVGTWVFVKAKAMGMEIPASMMGTSMTLVLKEDGVASLITDNDENDLEWTLKDDSTVVLSVLGNEIFTVIYDGSTLTLEAGDTGVLMIFEKQ